jgi:hypothetical protein
MAHHLTGQNSAQRSHLGSDCVNDNQTNQWARVKVNQSGHLQHKLDGSDADLQEQSRFELPIRQNAAYTH